MSQPQYHTYTMANYAYPNPNTSHTQMSTFVCSHGIVMNEIEDSHFHPDSVGKFHVPIQRLKRTKSRGSVWGWYPVRENDCKPAVTAAGAPPLACCKQRSLRRVPNG